MCDYPVERMMRDAKITQMPIELTALDPSGMQDASAR
jgi:hypothetical protein